MTLKQVWCKTMMDTNEGKLTVWRTGGSLDNMALGLCEALTADGERLIVIDAAGCLDPGHISRASASAARSLHVIRAAPTELESALCPAVREARRRTQARRVLLAGALDHLYGRDMQTRDAARALGRLKSVLGTLTRAGLDVTVACSSEAPQAGVRTFLLQSLCAAAQEVYCWPSAAQQYVDGASAAIA